MSAKKFNPEDLISLVELEISVMKRYYNHTKDAITLSLIYFKLPRENSGYEEILERILRNTDAVFEEGEHVVALLYATNKTGASKLLSGIQEFLNEKPIDIIASYPKDAKDAKTLITKFQDDIRDNYGILLDCLRIEEPIDIYEF